MLKYYMAVCQASVEWLEGHSSQGAVRPKTGKLKSCSQTLIPAGRETMKPSFLKPKTQNHFYFFCGGRRPSECPARLCVHIGNAIIGWYLPDRGSDRSIRDPAVLTLGRFFRLGSFVGPLVL